MANADNNFFRVDRSGHTKRLMIVAAFLVTLGATTVGAHLVSHFSQSFAHGVALLGGMIVVSGLILGFGGLAMLVFENVYLLIEEEGILIHDNGKETSMSWSDLETVALGEDAGFVVFACKDGPPLRWFAGRGAKNLHARVEEAKRKALHGLLKMSD